MDITKAHYDRLTDEIHTHRASLNLISTHLRWRILGTHDDITMSDQELLEYMVKNQELLFERMAESIKSEREVPVQASVTKA